MINVQGKLIQQEYWIDIFLIQKNRTRHPQQAKQKQGWNGWKIENTCSSDVQVQVKLFDVKKIPGTKLYNEDDTLRLQRSNQEPSNSKLERLRYTQDKC